MSSFTFVVSRRLFCLLPIMKIGTHNGTFHCDEVLACAMLRLLPVYENCQIVRSRAPEALDECDVVVDVGGVYDPLRHRYDHHQRSFNESMRSLSSDKKQWITKLSSAGLIYFHFGRDIIAHLLDITKEEDSCEIIFDKIYEKLIEEVDAVDNGLSACECLFRRYSINTGLSSRVAHLNPAWNDPDANETDQFYKALDVVQHEFVDRVQYFYHNWLPARSLVENSLNNRHQTHPSGRVISLGQFCPWKEHLFNLEQELCPQDAQILYVLYAEKNGSWRIQCVPKLANTFENRKSLPVSWRGLRDTDLDEKISIPGCIFVHAGGFIGGHKNYDGVLRMAELAVKNVTD